MQKTILLAEDDADHAELIRRAVNQVSSEYLIDTVSNGAEMIDYLFITGPSLGLPDCL